MLVPPYTLFKYGDEMLINGIWHRMEPKEIVEQSWGGVDCIVRRPCESNIDSSLHRSSDSSLQVMQD